MKGILILAAMVSYAWANEATETTPEDLTTEIMYLGLTSKPGDLEVEQAYEIPKVSPIIVPSGPVQVKLLLKDVLLKFHGQPSLDCTLSLSYKEDLRFECTIEFPLTVMTGKYKADFRVEIGNLKETFTGYGTFTFKAKNIAIEILATLSVQSGEILTVDELKRGSIDFGHVDFTATGAKQNGKPMSEKAVKNTANDFFPLYIFVTQPGFEETLRAGIDAALARKPYKEWKSEASSYSSESEEDDEYY